MKKKWIVLGSTIGISTVVMATTGFTALAGTSGYEMYKSALKNTKTAKSVSVQAEVTLLDNGATLNDAKGSLKVSLADHTASGTVSLAGQDNKQSLTKLVTRKQAKRYGKQAIQTYITSNRRIEEREKDNDPNEQDSAWLNNQAETVIDVLVGNLQNEVVSDQNQDGTQHLSLQLSNAQIPAILQALAPLAFKQLSGHHEGNRASDSNNTQENADKLFESNLIKPSQLSLTQDIQITNIVLQADVDSNNYITNQLASITFTGKDASSAERMKYRLT